MMMELKRPTYCKFAQEDQPVSLSGAHLYRDRLYRRIPFTEVRAQLLHLEDSLVNLYALLIEDRAVELHVIRLRRRLSTQLLRACTCLWPCRQLVILLRSSLKHPYFPRI